MKLGMKAVTLDVSVGPYRVSTSGARVAVRTCLSGGAYGFSWMPIRDYLQCFEEKDRDKVRAQIAALPKAVPSWSCILFYMVRWPFVEPNGLKFAGKLILERFGIATV